MDAVITRFEPDGTTVAMYQSATKIQVVRRDDTDLTAFHFSQTDGRLNSVIMSGMTRFDIECRPEGE